MKILLVGSRALSYYSNDFKCKDDSDWDIICDDSDMKNKLDLNKVEVHSSNVLNNYELERYTSTSEYVIINGYKLHPVNLKGLSIIKRSHLYRDYFFDKHITMYHKHLKNHFILDNDDFRIYNEREKLTHELFDKFKHPSLNKSVEDFFDDYVTKKYNHDYLHELFKYKDEPMYKKMQRDYSKAWCEKDLWHSFTYEEKCMCVAEETYVIATERFLVPKNWNYSTKFSYLQSLKKVCTTLTSGWFRDFAIDEFPTIFSLYDENKFKGVKLILEKI